MTLRGVVSLTQMDIVAFVGFYPCPSFEQACDVHKEQGCLFPLLPESLSQNCVKRIKEAPQNGSSRVRWDSVEHGVCKAAGWAPGWITILWGFGKERTKRPQ